MTDLDAVAAMNSLLIRSSKELLKDLRTAGRMARKQGFDEMAQVMHGLESFTETVEAHCRAVAPLLPDVRQPSPYQAENDSADI